MVKKMMIMLLLVSIVASAMKRAEPESEQKYCLFALLPLDVLNKIAWYLDFCETDEECKARVKNQTAVSVEHIRQLEKLTGLIYSFLPVKPLAAYSIDQSKIIFLRTADDIQCVGDRVIAPACVGMFDIQEAKLISHRFGDSVATNMTTNTQGIALSHDGLMLAEIRTVTTSGRGRNIERMFYKDELVVRISPMHQKRFTLSEDSNHNEYKIGFNKQNTKIAALATKKVWNQEKKEIEEREDNQLLPLVSEEEHTVRSECSLQNYFSLNMICKSLRGKGNDEYKS